MRYRSALWAVVLACMVGSSSALGQPSQAEIEASKKAAAESANQAFDAFKQGKYEDAIAGFEKAEKAFHATKFLLYIARAQVKLGRLVAARSTYEMIVKEQLPAYAPAEFFAAQGDAKKELVDLLARIPTLRIQGKAGITTVTLDGRPALVGEPIALDPGEHTLVGSGPGLPEVQKKVTLQEREAKTETLEPASVAPPATATATATSTATATATSTATAPAATGGVFSGPIPTVTYVAYGVGAAGLIVGGIFGGLTLSAKGEHDKLINSTPVSAKAVNESAGQGRTFAVVSDIGFLTAIVGAGVGTIVWAVSPRSPAAKTGRSVVVSPGVGSVSVGGTF